MSMVEDLLLADPKSISLPTPKQNGPRPGTPGQLRSLANLRPPWKKGERPPGAGKPKKTLTEALIKRLGKKRAIEVATALIDEAAAGNVPAFNALADRIEGKVAEKIEVSGNVDLGLRIAAARERRRLRSGTNDVDAEIVRDRTVQDSNGTSALQDVDWKDVAGE